ncbi:MAG: helix-turn-helix domain-containing protein [bacterium]|nr:helix-turn-helix domain-containing protein [bacterium]
METQKTFGSFIREKRLAAGINLRKMSGLLEIAPAYLSDIENDHRYPPEKEKIYRIAEVLDLNRQETDELFDLSAGNKKNLVSPDLADYIMAQDKSRVALRLARDSGAGEKVWEKIIRLLEEERNKQPSEE